MELCQNLTLLSGYDDDDVLSPHSLTMPFPGDNGEQTTKMMMINTTRAKVSRVLAIIMKTWLLFHTLMSKEQVIQVVSGQNLNNSQA